MYNGAICIYKTSILPYLIGLKLFTQTINFQRKHCKQISFINKMIFDQDEI